MQHADSLRLRYESLTSEELRDIARSQDGSWTPEAKLLAREILNERLKTRHIEQHLSGGNETLRLHLGFTESDLEANRQGRMSAEQKRKLEADAKFKSVLGISLIVLVCLGFAWSIWARFISDILGFAFLFLATAGVALSGFAISDLQNLTHAPIMKVSGMPTKIRGGRDRQNIIEIQGTRFDAGGLWNLLNEKYYYEVYYFPNNMQIISIFETK